MAKFYLNILLLVFLGGASFAQSFQMNKQIKGLDLPSENVYDIDQDTNGQVWFSTARGVFYSDGINTYSLPDSLASKIGHNGSFEIDEDGLVWVYEQKHPENLYYLKNNQWQFIPLPSTLKNAYGASGIFLDIIGSGSNKTIVLSVPGVISVLNMTHGMWDHHSFVPEQYGSPKSVSMIQPEEFVLFFEKSSLHYLKGDMVPYLMKAENLPSPVWAVKYNEQDGLYYFLGNNFLAAGTSISAPQKIVSTGFSKGDYLGGMKFGLQVKQGQVYYFFNSQLFKFNPKNSEILEISTFDALKSFYINTSFVDRENIIWIGTVRGVVNLPTLRFQNFNKWGGLLDHEVSAILNVGKNETLYGFNNGIQFWKSGKVTFQYQGEGEQGEPRNRITNFHQDSNGIVWFSAAQKGVGRLNLMTQELEIIPAPDNSFVVHVMAKGDDLYIVAGERVYKSDIYKRGKQHFESDITDSLFANHIKVAPNRIRKLDFTQDGKLVVMAAGWTSLQNNVIDNEKALAFIGFDWKKLDDRYLLGTSDGLKVYDGENFFDFEINGQKISRPVYGLVLDQQENIWVGTDEGVAIIGNGTIRYFNDFNGLSGNEINRGAFVLDHNGRIQIGTQHGLSIFIPEEDQVGFAEPRVGIKKVKVLGVEEDIPLDEIPYEHNNVEFEFSAISFLQITHFTVSYKLDGFHSDWQHLQNPRTNTLQFNNLPAGDYQLMLKASIGGQFESGVTYSEKFSIIKPVYLQSWFIGLIILFVLMLGFGLSMLINQFKQRGVLEKSIDAKNQEIKTAEDQFRNVWNGSQDGLMLVYVSGEILAVNPAMVKLAGMAANYPVQGGHARDFFRSEEFFEEHKNRITQALNTAQGSTMEALVPFHSGERNIDLYVTRANPGSRERTVILLVFRDVTDKKEYEAGLREAKERAEEASRMKSNFLSNMSHEIRTPLNGILGSTENIIYQNKDNHILVSQLEIIMESGDRLLKTINSILDMSRIEANKMEINYEEVNINDFLSNLLIPLKTMAIRKNLLLTCRFETKPFIGKVDKSYFEMIVNNIVGNAIKYSDGGLIKVLVKKEKKSLVLQVKDAGIGMSEEFIAKIYAPFEQESGGYDRRFEGTGLGLSITKSLVELQKGSIEIKSKKNIGTTVVVKLPIE
ncbi:hypothetical protein GCM10007049_36540 [Echinicola pacifica]|uniref:histidine kinase n=1 Tax=Echinicola pacifica TaxID=346377 RepID=A0A918QBN8_9BACT|nr:ATP-binding protein [Echinicola pacifica]GGZ39835.1 hypothetical protein GCM10007049_36540 [Echinicola pacifica]